jgi:DNA-nicking Smr family endonuclease
MQTLRDLVEGDAPLDITETEETLEGSVPGLDPRVLRQLRAGEFSIQDHLDLHQLTRQEARERVERFLHDSILHGKRCVLIIHGRGLGSKDHVPVLKNALRAWFQRSGVRKQILAFTTARPCDGGSGAVYVLLRKRQRG